MKAAQIRQYGDASVLRLESAAPDPVVGPGKVLVEVHAASINPVDSAVRAGYMQKMVPLTFPATLGVDFAGVVLQIGQDVKGLSRQDRVYGSGSVLGGGSGTFAELVVTPEAMVARIPQGLSFTDAASLPLAGASALQAIDDQIKLAKGQKILIHGGAGGIGTIAVQLAKHRGAYVVATVRGDEASYVKGLGADEVIDEKGKPFDKVLSGFDAVFDNVAGDTYKRSFAVLKKGGIIVSMREQPNAELAQKYGVTALGQFTQVSTARLDRLAELVKAGFIKPQVHKVFPLDDVKGAFAAREGGKVRGKVVLKIR